MFRHNALLCLVMLLTGCGIGENAAPTTKSPAKPTFASAANNNPSTVSQNDLDAARKKFHLRDDLQLEAKGYAVHQLTADISGTYFKFIAKTDKIENVFLPDVDRSKFHANALLTPSSHDAWWDVADREFNGGNVKLPDGEEMSVGYVDNKDGTLTVYIEM